MDDLAAYVFCCDFRHFIGIIFALMRLSAPRTERKPFFGFCRNLYRCYSRYARRTSASHTVFCSIARNRQQGVGGCYCFSINSGAYKVAEIVRAGIQVSTTARPRQAVLGLSQRATMQYIIIPQAMKNILPALVNELYVL